MLMLPSVEEYRSDFRGFHEKLGRKTDRGENCIMMELHSLYYSTNIVRVIKSRRMR
jgi:hypothetical protein